jgi:hypothetical protein
VIGVERVDGRVLAVVFIVLRNRASSLRKESAHQAALPGVKQESSLLAAYCRIQSRRYSASIRCSATAAATKSMSLAS